MQIKKNREKVQKAWVNTVGRPAEIILEHLKQFQGY
jgi:hypothetical protein